MSPRSPVSARSQKAPARTPPPRPGARRAVSAPPPTPDYTGWLTKQQAADAIGVSTKTIEKFAQERKIEQARWQRPTGGPLVAVYQPDDVGRLATERRGEHVPFVMPAIGTGAIALATRPPDPGAAGLGALLGALQATAEKFQKPSALFLTLPEAAAFTGLSQAYLRRLLEAGTLTAIRDRGWRIRRRDLEAL